MIISRMVLPCLVTLAVFVLSNVYAESLERAVEAFDFEEYDNAAVWLQPWAIQGEVEAQYRLGILYQEGRGVSPNVEQALKWFRLAAEQDHRGAKRRLKKLLRGQSSGPAEAESVATRWYKDLAEEGDTNAQYQLGVMYEVGWGVPVDGVRAAHWYELAAQDGHSKAQLRLGMMYLIGAGVHQSAIQGEKLITWSAQSGEPLARLIQKEILKADKALRFDKKKIIRSVRAIAVNDEDRAVQMVMDRVKAIKLKARQEEERKKEQLAKIKKIESAAGQKIVAKDQLLGPYGEKTFPWYQREAKKGDADAQFMLGWMYEIGAQTGINLPEAVHWYLSAAEQDHSEAQYYLGMLYAYGIILPQDDIKSKNMLTAAARKGHRRAKEALTKAGGGSLPFAGQSVAIWWLEKFARQGSARAQFNLGYLYETGRGVGKDMRAAKRWYQLAAQQGYPAARQRLEELGIRN